jgi:hypothetical protein
MGTRLPLQQRDRVVFWVVLTLVATNLVVSVGTLAAVVAARDGAVMVDLAVSGRVVGGTMSSIFASRVAWGSRRAFPRLRVVAAIMTTTAVPPLVTPGLPGWLKLEQATCGLLMLGVFLLVNGRRLRGAFGEPLPCATGDPVGRADEAGGAACAVAVHPFVERRRPTGAGPPGELSSAPSL